MIADGQIWQPINGLPVRIALQSLYPFGPRSGIFSNSVISELFDGTDEPLVDSKITC